MTKALSATGFSRAGFRRRLAVIVYDFLVVVAIGLLANILALLFVELLFLLDVTQLGDAEDVSSFILDNTVNRTLFQIYLLASIGYFYIWFWSHGGQTVGMKTWRLRVQNTNGHDLSKKQAFIRLLTALGGLGNLLVLVDRKNKCALQDRCAKCEVVLLTKEANQHKNWQKLY